MEYYSAFKRKENLTPATTWMNLEGIRLGEMSRSQKDKPCVTPETRFLEYQTHGDRKQSGGCQGLGGEGEWAFIGTESQLCKMKGSGGGDVIAQQWKCTNLTELGITLKSGQG